MRIRTLVLPRRRKKSSRYQPEVSLIISDLFIKFFIAPGVVRDLQIIWSKFEDAYFLHFVEPEQTNSPLRSYHVFLKYTDPSAGLKELVKSVPASSHEVSIKFDQVCKSVMDTVHVTVLAYGSDLKNGLIPGRPMLRTYKCADLIIEGRRDIFTFRN